MLNDAYRYAVKQASAETGIPIAQFPVECTLSFEQI
jgi:hypothetical protein